MVDKSMSHAKGTSSKYHPMEEKKGQVDVQRDYDITNNLGMNHIYSHLHVEKEIDNAPLCFHSHATTLEK
jgi:hypothetical protein